MWKTSSTFVLLVLVTAVVAQNRKCILQDNCEKCLLIDPACAWCTDRNYNLKKPRCMTPEELVVAGCGSVYQNKYVGLEILENQALMDYSYEKAGGGSSSSRNSSSTSSQSSSSGTLESTSGSSVSSSSGGSGASGSASGGSGSGSGVLTGSSAGSTSSSSSSSGSSEHVDVIQIQPQRIKLSIAKGKKHDQKSRLK